jgi:Flp pilus assembly protein TadD
MHSVRQLRKLVKQRPDDARLWYDLSVALANEGELKETHESLRRALGCPPQAPDLCILIGMSLDGLKDFEAAAEAYHRAASLEPSSPRGFSHLGSLYLKHGRADLALAPLRRAVRLSSYSPEACIRYASSLEKQNQLDEAVSFYHIAAHARPDEVEAQRPLGRLLGKMGHISGAIRAWRKVAELVPGEPGAMTALGILLSTWGDHVEAVRLLAEVVHQRPSSPESLSDLGMALSRSGSHEAALRALRQAVQLRKDSSQIRLNLGVALMNAGLLEDAMSAFLDVVSASPDWPIAHLNLGLCYSALGDLVAAREVLLKASTIDPQNVEIKGALRETLIKIVSQEAPSSPPGPSGPSAPAQSMSQPPHRSKDPTRVPSKDGAPRQGKTPSSDGPGPQKRKARPRFLTGELRVFPLVEVLEFLKVSQSNGVLDVTSKKGRGLLAMQKGDLSGATSPNTRDILDILVEQRAVTRDDVDVAIEAQGRLDHTVLGLMLVDDGIVPMHSFERALETQIKGALMEIISWKDGEFSFREASETTGATSFQSRITIDTRGIIMDVVRSLDEAARNQAR